MSCPFCQIRDRTLPAECVYEDEEILGFNDIHPQAPVHLLVIPKRHIPSIEALTETDAGLVGRMIRVAAQLAQERGVSSEGYRLVINCNAWGGQTVFHLHLHLLAGRPMNWPPG